MTLSNDSRTRLPQEFCRTTRLRGLSGCPTCSRGAKAPKAWVQKSSGKEVVQPQVPLRLPCYDLVPITELAMGVTRPCGSFDDFKHSQLSWLDGQCVQGSGTYSPRCG
jgi:hypothetical protein